MRYYLPTEKVKSKKKIFDQPIKNDIKTHENIRKITTGRGDDYTTGYLYDYNYLIKHYKMIAVDLSKQQVLDTTNWLYRKFKC